MPSGRRDWDLVTHCMEISRGVIDLVSSDSSSYASTESNGTDSDVEIPTEIIRTESLQKASSSSKQFKMLYSTECNSLSGLTASFWNQGKHYKLHDVEAKCAAGFNDEDFLLMGEQPNDNVTAVAAQRQSKPNHFKKSFSADDVLNGPLSPPNLLAHNKCVLEGKSHNVTNCFEVNVWQLPDAVINKRAANEAWENQYLSPDKQDYKWRKVQHKKNEGKELDKVEQKWEELRLYEEKVMRHAAKLVELEEVLEKKRAFLHERNRELDLKCMCCYKSVCSLKQHLRATRVLKLTRSLLSIVHFFLHVIAVICVYAVFALLI